jgi:hypothetical protein
MAGNALLIAFEKAEPLLPDAIRIRRWSCVIRTDAYLPAPRT